MNAMHARKESNRTGLLAPRSSNTRKYREMLLQKRGKLFVPLRNVDFHKISATFVSENFVQVITKIRTFSKFNIHICTLSQVSSQYSTCDETLPSFWLGDILIRFFPHKDKRHEAYFYLSCSSHSLLSRNCKE